jgi:hypothetical protein
VGPLLSGSLDSRFAPDASPTGVGSGGVITAGVAGSPLDGSNFAGLFSSGGFWVVVLVIVGAAWFVDSRRDRD